MAEPKRIIVGISGASGIVYGIRVLELLRASDVETHLVISKPSALTRTSETNLDLEQITSLADHYHKIGDVGASIASGSFKTMGMIVAPCSIHTLSEIADCGASNLLTRSADVVLKERRRLVLMVRETPLHTGHLKKMLSVSEMGGIIAPPVPAFYSNPKSLDEMVNYTSARALDLFGLDLGKIQRWSGMDGESSA
jgi:4-hydroxy-3-polyprenylbenzoate decarboxylase